jgi:DNA polymerase
VTTPVLHIDFETRSTVDLRKTGRFVYAEHPTTDIVCAAYAFGDTEVFAVENKNLRRHQASTAIGNHVKKGGLILCHNAGFEYSMWKSILGPRYGWPVPNIRQMRCTAAMARAMSLPGDLDGAAMAVGLEHRKDAAGHRLMLAMCKPRRYRDDGTPEWWDDEDRMRRLIAYCRQDVEVERALERRLRPLSSSEQELWFLDQVINERGVYLDQDAIKDAAYIAQAEVARIDREIRRLTKYSVSGASKAGRLLEFLKAQGVEIETLRKTELKDYLEAFGEEIDPIARQIIELRLSAAKTSTKKLDAMMKRRQADGRARENLIYHGAGTGRWTGVGIQLQNMISPPEDFDMDGGITLLKPRDPEYIRIFEGDVMQHVANCTRGMIKAPPGYDLIAADFSNIEGRGLAWLAGEEWKLDAFRAFDAGEGPDLYKATASGIFGKHHSEISKAERQIGKVSELACGYQGGVGAFQSFAKIYRVKIPDTQADVIKCKWREAHPATVQYWYDLEAAAMRAVCARGSIVTLKNLKFTVNGNVLWLRLPSGRCLAYPDPKIMEVDTPWGEKKMAVTYMGVDQKTRQWVRIKTYGGKWAENVTQAVARDIMSDAMKRVEKAGYPVIFTVHDEVVAEILKTFGDLAEFVGILEEVPNWAKGFPIKAAGWRGERYRK